MAREKANETEPKRTRAPRTVDPEMAALVATKRSLGALEPQARMRVLAYLVDWAREMPIEPMSAVQDVGRA